MIRTASFALALVALPLCALSGASSVVYAAEEAAPTARQSLPSIVVTTATERMLTERVLATGTVRAVEDVFVSPLVEGLPVQTLNADVGDRVEAGSTLAVLNPDTLNLQKSQLNASLAKSRASLAQIRAQLVEAQANAQEAVRVRDRSRRLATSGSLSTAQADQTAAAADAALARVTSAEQSIEVAQADIEVVQAQIADIDLRVNRTAVTTPVSGVVSARNAKVGAIATGAGDPLFALIRDGAVELVADVPEAEILKLKVDQPVLIRLAGSTATLDGNIRLIAPTIDAQTRLGTVHIRFKSPDNARVGMYGSAEIIVQQKQGLALPLTAITTARSETITRRVEDGVVKFATITTGIQDGQFIEIASGLKAGEKVVAKAGAYVRDGDRINPVDAQPVAPK